MDNMPKVDLENFEVAPVESPAAKDISGGALKFAFVGSGQCGSRLAEAFYKLGYHKCLVINTASQDLEYITVPTKIHIKPQDEIGGAGKDMKKAMAALDPNKELIYNKMMTLFGDDVDHIFICAGLGGGTGGGTVLGLVELAKKFMAYIGKSPDKQVGVIATLPTHGEATTKLIRQNANTVAKQLTTMADKNKISPVIVIDNQKIDKLYKSLPVKQFYPTINSSVAQLLHIFNFISLQPSQYTPCDPTDLQSVLEAGGYMVLGVSAVNEFAEESISDALRQNLTRTLLADDFDLSTAKAASVIVVGGESIFESIPGLKSAIEYGFDTIANFTGEAKLHRGIYADSSRQNLVVYTMIGGLAAPAKRYEKLI